MSKLHRNRVFSKENSDHHVDFSTLDGLKAYRESVRAKGNHAPKKDPNEISGYAKWSIKPRPKQSPPWYFLRKVERIAIESQRPKTRMSHEDYIDAYIVHKTKKWERKHPRPCETDDLFKEEFIPIWGNERKTAIEKIIQTVHNKYDVIVSKEVTIGGMKCIYTPIMDIKEGHINFKRDPKKLAA